MPRYSVKIDGEPLLAAMTALNGAGIPTLGAGAHWGSSPPPGWELDSLRAIFDAESAADAKAALARSLPPQGSYQLGEPEEV